MADAASSEPARPTLDARGVRILAKSLLEDLRSQGFADEQVVGLTTELLALLAADLRARRSR
jgi:hypothetical protein